jgi:putative PIN family toxin of toxin-antitoxin system
VFVVFDTNVLISRVLGSKESAVSRSVRFLLEKGACPLFSEATLKELSEVLGRSKFDPYISQEKRQHFLSQMREISIVIPIDRHFTDCRDPKDNMFLDVSVCGGAEYLITGDADLLVLHPFEGVNILSPIYFLESDFCRNFNP